MSNPITSLLDRITMYKLLLYYLIGLLLAAFGLSLAGRLGYKPLYIAISAILLPTVCWVLNKVFAWIFRAPINSESSLLTGLILALVITPDPTLRIYGLTFMLAAAGLAMASKYILTIRRKHIFNPAAIAVVLTAFGPRQDASWWVGTAVMLPFVLVGGVLVAVKLRRVVMTTTFFASAIVATVLFSLFTHESTVMSLHSLLITSPLFFMGYVMLTEPMTSPPTALKQNTYAVIVGALLPPQVHLFSLYTSPELAIIAGNIFSYIVSPKTKLFPILKKKERIATDSADFIFDPGAKLPYKPGQYMEWTLPHHRVDLRGNRRYFTLASSPTEPEIRIGVKFYERGSSYKRALLTMDSATPIVAAQVAGDFTLPADKAKKLIFIAGGIGITPFRSMTKYLLDTQESRSVALLYSVKTPGDIAYGPLFEEARQKIGLETTYILTGQETDASQSNMMRGPITSALIKKVVPDYTERLFYLSGTHPMVSDVRKILLEIGVHQTQIKTDFFPGYV